MFLTHLALGLSGASAAWRVDIIYVVFVVALAGDGVASLDMSVLELDGVWFEQPQLHYHFHLLASHLWFCATIC